MGAGAAEPTVPPPDPALELRLNVPAYRLDVYEQEARTGSFTVAVGMPAFPTPRGQFAISRVTWNPWWIPPDRDWARGEKPMPPGPANPMGRVKLHAGGILFVHGTPDTGTLGRPASHGCIRLSNPEAVELARLVQRYGSPDLPARELDRLESDPTLTRTIPLAHPVALRIVYELAEVRDGTLWLYPDVYGRGGALGQARRALEQSAYGGRIIDEKLLEELVHQARRAAVSVPIDALLLPGAG